MIAEVGWGLRVTGRSRTGKGKGRSGWGQRGVKVSCRGTGVRCFEVMF